MKALSIKSDREIWLVDVAATSPVSPTVTVQGTDKVLPPEPIEKNTLRHPFDEPYPQTGTAHPAEEFTHPHGAYLSGEHEGWL